MRRPMLIALAAMIALIGGGCFYYHQCTQVKATWQSAETAVDSLYRNRSHVLPATDLTQAKLQTAKARLKQVPQNGLSTTQQTRLNSAQQDVAAAENMLTVTQATNAPLAASTTYSQDANKALSAYAALQTAKPVFTQVYQNPVATLKTNKQAVEAVTALQQEKVVTQDAITATKAAIAQVAGTDTQAFNKQADTIVESAEHKLDAPTASPEVPAASPSESSASVASGASSTMTATSTSAQAATTASATTSSASSASTKDSE